MTKKQGWFQSKLSSWGLQALLTTLEEDLWQELNLAGSYEFPLAITNSGIIALVWN